MTRRMKQKATTKKIGDSKKTNKTQKCRVILLGKNGYLCNAGGKEQISEISIPLEFAEQ